MPCRALRSIFGFSCIPNHSLGIWGSEDCRSTGARCARYTLERAGASEPSCDQTDRMLGASISRRRGATLETGSNTTRSYSPVESSTENRFCGRSAACGTHLVVGYLPERMEGSACQVSG